MSKRNIIEEFQRCKLNRYMLWDMMLCQYSK